MSKAFRYFFQKRDRKDGENIHRSNRENTRGITPDETRREEVAKEGARKYSPVRRRTSESLRNDPIYLNRLFGISNEGTLKLFHTSSEEDFNVSDKEPKYKRNEKQPISSVSRKNFNNIQVYPATVTRNSTSLNPPRPSEPFPYKVYDSAPRRSTLYYGVDYNGNPINSDERPRLSITKGDDNNAVPSTSQSDVLNHPPLQNTEDDRERSVQHRKRVTLVAPNELGDIPSMNDYQNETNELAMKPTRKTVLRFRPHSSASRNSELRESVKLMVFRTDQIEHPPMVLSRHVHQIPLKRTNPTPVLMTDDGRVLKPLDNDKQTRNSFCENKEASRVRISMADIEKICKDQRKSTEITNPNLYSRNSMKRNSIRQSMISRQVENEKKSSVWRGNREEPRMSYHYNVEDKNSIVFGIPVPVTPSRNRSSSHISGESIASYDLNQYQRHNNEGTRYYVDESTPIDNEHQCNRVSYQSDHMTVNKDKPVVVYEVHKLGSNSRSISRNSITSGDPNNVYTKAQQSNTQKQYTTNQLIEPQVEIVYQEPTTQFQSTNKNKEKQSLRNKIKIYKTSENYMNGSSPINQQQPVVYVAEVPSGSYPVPQHETRKCSFSKKRNRTSCNNKETLQSKDFCGLSCEPQEKNVPLREHMNSNFKMVSSSQQTDYENDIDFLCYPAEKLSNNPKDFPETDSKLKWRIIIKKPES